jgi:amino acid transporter
MPAAPAAPPPGTPPPGPPPPATPPATPDSISMEFARRQKKVEQDADDTTWFHTLSAAMGIGLLAILIYAGAERSWRVFGCAVLLALAAALVGAFAGFIFGIPKTVEGGASAATTAAYQGNTNLEQISDWLTKILVGAGLVELKTIYSTLQAFGSQFIKHPVLGSLGWVAAPALVIVYSLCGFLIAYLWARIYMIADLESRRFDKTLAAAVQGSIPPPPRTTPPAIDANSTAPAGNPTKPGADVA